MRLDKYLAENGFSSRTKAARAIAEGLVYLNGRIGKPSDEISEKDEIKVLEKPVSFVSEGGYKLRKAFDDFGVDVRGCICVDLGASTGGFTDCLLQAGAGRVCSVDVGKDQLDLKLRSDPRVQVMDGINVRYLRREDIAEERIDVVTADLSFISLKLILPVIGRLLGDGGEAYILVKPQFECGGIGLDKHGIVKDRQKRHSVVFGIAEDAARIGLKPVAITTAPIHEKKNIEYVMRLQKSFAGPLGEDFKSAVAKLE